MNSSKGILGNRLTANDCQNAKFCDIVETWKILKNGTFLKKIVKSHFKIGTMKIPEITR